jgi:transcriptional regulator with XRE-family HTH domain
MLCQDKKSQNATIILCRKLRLNFKVLCYNIVYKVVFFMIGKRLKEVREKRKWTQTYVANQMGIAPNTYNNYENDTRGVSEEMLVKIADLFGVSIDYLLGRVNVPDGVLTAMERNLSDSIELNEKDFLKLNITVAGKPLTTEEKKLFRALIRAKRGLE